ncbi:MAG: hypothetical protein K2X47_20140, partial [Bdellovibrionales bacterium]|nr:hypothetical protein [Bdellovibrionales bacterium]
MARSLTTGAVRVTGAGRVDVAVERVTRGSTGADGFVGVKGCRRVGRASRGVVDGVTGVRVTLGGTTGVRGAAGGVVLRAGRSHPEEDVFAGGVLLRSTGRLGAATVGVLGVAGRAGVVDDGGTATVDVERSG